MERWRHVSLVVMENNNNLTSNKIFTCGKWNLTYEENEFQEVHGWWIQSVASITVGLFGLVVFLALILAGYLLFWLVNLSGKPSVKHGIPYPVFA